MKKHGFSMIELVVSLMLLGIIYLNVAGLFKTNLHQDQVFYGTFADTWNQYNTVIDAVYNRKSIPLTSTTATVVLTDVATLLEQEMLSNTPTVIAKDSVVLQKLSVQYKLPTHKDIKYDILSINTLDNKIIASDGIVHTDEIQSYLPVHKTRVWTLANNNSYIVSYGPLSPLTNNWGSIKNLVYVKLKTPAEFNYGDGFHDTLFFSHFYYVDNSTPLVLGYDSNGYGIAIKASDQIAYPTYLTRTPDGTDYKYKTNEYPVIPLRQVFYYAGMPVLYQPTVNGNNRTITISIGKSVAQFSPNTAWGNFVTSVVSSYSYGEKYLNGTWDLDSHNAANIVNVSNWLPDGNVLLNSDITELAVNNEFSGKYLYGRTVVPINLLYDLSRGKLYADLDANGNIVVHYNSAEKQLKDSTTTIKLSELAKISDTNNIDKSYTFNWPPPSCGTKNTHNYIQAQISDTVNKKNILKTQNMLAKTLAFDIKVAHKPFESDGFAIASTCTYQTKVYEDFGPCDMTATVPCSRGTCESGRCYDWVTHTWSQEYVVLEQRHWAYGYVKLTSITAHISTPYGSKDIKWSTNKQYSIDNLLSDNATYTLTVTLANPDPSKLFYDKTPNILNSLFDPNHKKVGDISVTYDVAFDIGATAEIHIFCSESKCHIPEDDLIPLEKLLSGFDVHIEVNKEKSTFVPALTFAEALPYNIYSFRASPNPQLYVFTSAYTAKADYSQKDFTGWYISDNLECGSGAICDILSSAPMQSLGLYSTDYVVTKPADSRYYLKNSPGQVRNNISNDTHYAIFHGYTPNIRLEGTPRDTGSRVSVIAKKPLTLAEINNTTIYIEKIMVRQTHGGDIPYQ